MERVYPNTKPEASELIKEISTEISRNETQSIVFCVRGLKDLGKVSVTATPLKGKSGIVHSDSLRIGTVRQLTETIQKGKDERIFYYRVAPKTIESGDMAIPKDHTQSYWITLKVDSRTMPGNYQSTIKIKPERGSESQITVHVRVFPLTLTDTDIDYGMMMDYAFYEMDNDTWTEEEKKLIKKSGTEIYEDLKDHGMTMIYPHSYFFYKVDKNGEPVLNSMRASLKSYKNLQFPGPFVWYLGHLLQTAKSMHPGSILNYDPQVAKKRLHDLLMRFETITRELKIPKDKLIVQLVDEPDPDQKERTQAGKELHKVAKALGFQTLITRPWTDVDVICTGIPDNETQAKQLRNLAKEWWIYPSQKYLKFSV